MAQRLILLRGNDTQTKAYTGIEGEITVNLTTDQFVLHDGVTAGGIPMARDDKRLSQMPDIDVLTNAPTEGMSLTWSATAEKWVPKAIDPNSAQIDYESLSNRPNISDVAVSGQYNDLLGRPELATVATSGSYNDLQDIPAAAAAPSFETLTDTPDAAAMLAAKGLVVVVNAAGDGLEFVEKTAVGDDNVQSDWTEADNTNDSFIKNKPSLDKTLNELTDVTAVLALAEAGKVLTVNAAGDGLELQEVLKSDWNQADNTAIDFIKNKPTLVTKSEDLSDMPTLSGQGGKVPVVNAEGTALVYVDSTAIGDPNVQVDWAEDNSSSDRFILNKPSRDDSEFDMFKDVTLEGPGLSKSQFNRIALAASAPGDSYIQLGYVVPRNFYCENLLSSSLSASSNTELTYYFSEYSEGTGVDYANGFYIKVPTVLSGDKIAVGTISGGTNHQDITEGAATPTSLTRFSSNLGFQIERDNTASMLVTVRNNSQGGDSGKVDTGLVVANTTHFVLTIKVTRNDAGETGYLQINSGGGYPMSKGPEGDGVMLGWINNLVSLKEETQSDWNAASGPAHILNKPTIPAQADWSANSGTAQILNKPSIPFDHGLRNNAFDGQVVHKEVSTGSVTWASNGGIFAQAAAHFEQSSTLPAAFPPGKTTYFEITTPAGPSQDMKFDHNFVSMDSSFEPVYSKGISLRVRCHDTSPVVQLREITAGTDAHNYTQVFKGDISFTYGEKIGVTVGSTLSGDLSVNVKRLGGTDQSAFFSLSGMPSASRGIACTRSIETGFFDLDSFASVSTNLGQASFDEEPPYGTFVIEHEDIQYRGTAGNPDWDATAGKFFIRNKPTIPVVVPQQQADWAEDNTNSIRFIRNKPGVPDAFQFLSGNLQRVASAGRYGGMKFEGDELVIDSSAVAGEMIVCDNLLPPKFNLEIQTDSDANGSEFNIFFLPFNRDTGVISFNAGVTLRSVVSRFGQLLGLENTGTNPTNMSRRSQGTASKDVKVPLSISVDLSSGSALANVVIDSGGSIDSRTIDVTTHDYDNSDIIMVIESRGTTREDRIRISAGGTFTEESSLLPQCSKPLDLLQNRRDNLVLWTGSLENPNPLSDFNFSGKGGLRLYTSNFQFLDAKVHEVATLGGLTSTPRIFWDNTANSVVSHQAGFNSVSSSYSITQLLLSSNNPTAISCQSAVSYLGAL